MNSQPRQPHQYRGWMLTLLVLCYLLSLVFGFLEAWVTSGTPTTPGTDSSSSPSPLGSLAAILLLVL